MSVPIKQKPIGIDCDIQDNGTVIPHDGFEGAFMEDQGFRGNCQFVVLPARGTEPAYVQAIAQDSVTATPDNAESYTPWIPLAHVNFGRSPSDVSLPGTGEAIIIIDSEPPFYDPSFGNLYPLYGIGATFNLKVTFGATVEYDGAAMAGDGYSTPWVISDGSIALGPITFEADFSYGATVLQTITREFT